VDPNPPETAPGDPRWTADDARRIALTASCRDADDLPRARGAGEITDRDGVPVQVMHNGVVVEKDGYCGPWMTELIRRLGGCHEPQEERVFARVLERVAATEPDPSMIELGSSWAYYSLWFLSVLPAGRVAGVEPDPAFLALGQRNAALNGRSVTLLPGAIGPGSPLAADGEEVAVSIESEAATRPVPRRTVASLADEAGFGRISVLLADIQGAEAHLVEQLDGLIAAGRLRFVIISTHHHRLSGDPLLHRRVLDRLAGLGGHVVAEHSVAESYSGDGLVAVSYDPQDRDLTVEVSRCRAGDSLFGDPLEDLAEALGERDAARAAAAAQAGAATVAARQLAETRARLAALEGSKVWRWSQLPRDLYAKLRSGRPS